MAFNVLTQPTRLLDRPTWLLEEALARRREERDFKNAVIGQVRAGTFTHHETPVSDAIAKFERLKRELGTILLEHKKNGGNSLQLAAQVELATIAAGWKPGQ